MKYESQKQGTYVRLDNSLRKKIDAQAEKRRTTMSEVIRQILWDWADREAA